MKALAVVLAVWSLVATATVNLEYTSVITSTSSLPQALSSLSKSRHTTSSGRVAKMLSILV